MLNLLCLDPRNKLGNAYLKFGKLAFQELFMRHTKMPRVAEVRKIFFELFNIFGLFQKLKYGYQTLKVD